MSQSPLGETVALTNGKEIEGNQYTQVPVELELEKDHGSNAGNLNVIVQYRASQDRIIEIPLDHKELHHLHRLTEHLLEE